MSSSCWDPIENTAVSSPDQISSPGGAPIRDTKRSISPNSPSAPTVSCSELDSRTRAGDFGTDVSAELLEVLSRTSERARRFLVVGARVVPGRLRVEDLVGDAGTFERHLEVEDRCVLRRHVVEFAATSPRSPCVSCDRCPCDGPPRRGLPVQPVLTKKTFERCSAMRSPSISA